MQESIQEAQKLRVWWIPQLGADIPTYHKEVSSIQEAKVVMDVLAEYDDYQFQNKVKPDYCNSGGLQVLDENGEWEDWEGDIDGEYFDEVDEYLEALEVYAEENKVNDIC